MKGEKTMNENKNMTETAPAELCEVNEIIAQAENNMELAVMAAYATGLKLGATIEREKQSA